MSEQALMGFVEESNRIEGIHRVTDYEIKAHREFLELPEVRVPELQAFVMDVAARPLRDRPGMDVIVGNHRPPPGGPRIRAELSDLLTWAQTFEPTPWAVHVAYEQLHPFMDGNGRSGRVLWAWYLQEIGRDPFTLGFLHAWYYESLQVSQSEKS